MKYLPLLLILFSCKKDPIVTTCQCYEQQYTLGVQSGQLTYIYDRDGLPFTDFCSNNGKERIEGNKKYKQVCQ